MTKHPNETSTYTNRCRPTRDSRLHGAELDTRLGPRALNDFVTVKSVKIYYFAGCQKEGEELRDLSSLEIV